ncbi:MAG TPA: alpha/beta fold hydrolase [Polyangiaceae bacterium]|nr:alpha/beta fold hydrolase [Polyangiaceae bacterium]
MNSPWYQRFQASSPSLPRLICIPYAGAGSGVFRPWAAHLSKVAEVIAVQLPGRQERMDEPAFDSVSSLVPRLAEALLPLVDHPYVLFGHSLGAIIAFELALVLEGAASLGPQHLIASARRSPSFPLETPALHRLPDAQLIGALRAMGGTPEAVLADPDLMAALLPVVRADLKATEQHVSARGPRLQCPITVFGGLEDGLVSPEALTAWADATSGPSRVVWFDGGHFFIHDYRDQVLESVSDILGVSTRGPRPDASVRSGAFVQNGVSHSGPKCVTP